VAFFGFVNKNLKAKITLSELFNIKAKIAGLMSQNIQKLRI